LDATSGHLAQAAVQLLEAANCASRGDCASAQTYIESASALLKNAKAYSWRKVAQDRSDQEVPTRGALPKWRSRKVLAFIDDNLSRRLPVKELAAVARCSASHFSRAFAKRFRITPHAYIAARRMEMAQELMLTSSASLTDIALQCGMADQSHFTRVFRRSVGESPLKWRTARFDGVGRSPAKSSTFIAR
jgi:AraC family transcriptional regulator